VHLDEASLPEPGALVHSVCARITGGRDHTYRADLTMTQLLQRRAEEPGRHTSALCTLGDGDGQDLCGRQSLVVRPASVAHRLPDPTWRPESCGGGHESGEDRVVPQEVPIDAAGVLGDSDKSDDTVPIVGDQHERVV
jgi:hypothetical protein